MGLGGLVGGGGVLMMVLSEYVMSERGGMFLYR